MTEKQTWNYSEVDRAGVLLAQPGESRLLLEVPANQYESEHQQGHSYIGKVVAIYQVFQSPTPGGVTTGLSSGQSPLFFKTCVILHLPNREGGCGWDGATALLLSSFQ